MSNINTDTSAGIGSGKEFIDSDNNSNSGYSSNGTKKNKKLLKAKNTSKNTITSTTNNKKNETKKATYKKMTDDEINEYLKESMLIPPEDWEKLAVGSNISYFKKDNNFIKSGFIKTIYRKDDATTGISNLFILYGTKLNTYNNDKYYKEFIGGKN